VRLAKRNESLKAQWRDGCSVLIGIEADNRVAKFKEIMWPSRELG
jgi:hypothetical protein